MKALWRLPPGSGGGRVPSEADTASARGVSVFKVLPSIEPEMITHTLTSDPAVGLELGRRLAKNAKRRQPSRNRLGQMWSRLFPRPPVKLGTLHS